MEIFRIRNEAAFLLEDFRQFMLEVMESNKLVKDPMAALSDLAKQIHMDGTALFVTRDEQMWTGAAICQLSKTAFNPACIVIHLHCKEDDSQTRTKLGGAMFTFAQEGGYSDIVAIDTNHSPVGLDKLLGAVGKPTVLGEVFHFDLNESLL